MEKEMQFFDTAKEAEKPREESAESAAGIAYPENDPQAGEKNRWSTATELSEYIENLKKSDRNFEQFEQFEIKKLNKLAGWNKVSSYFESKNISGLENLNVILIEDESFWKSFYGSNDSKSSYDPMTIILKKDIFEKEGISIEDSSQLVHEVAHLLFYESLGDELERYMGDYYEKGIYTQSDMESEAFQMQFEFLKFNGKTRQECTELVRKYLDEVYRDDENGKLKEFEQLAKYIENIYGNEWEDLNV